MTLNLKERFAFTVARRFLIPCLFLLPLFLSAGDWQKRTKAHDAAVERISAKFGLKNTFIQAMIWRESRFKAGATGSVGEIGLMQLRMATVRDWAKAHHRKVPSRGSVYDTELNLTIGVWRIDQALKNWEGHPWQVQLALWEYNGGRSALLRTLAHYDGDVERVLNTTRAGRYAREVTALFEALNKDGDLRNYVAQSY